MRQEKELDAKDRELDMVHEWELYEVFRKDFHYNGGGGEARRATAPMPMFAVDHLVQASRTLGDGF